MTPRSTSRARSASSTRSPTTRSWRPPPPSTRRPWPSPVSGPTHLTSSELNLGELRRYARRISDRWPLERALLGGARVADAQGAPPQRERGEEYVVVLVSRGFDGIPWLERVHQAGSLWDASEMGGAADVHCYTPVEFERKRETLRAVQAAAERGLDLFAAGRARGDGAGRARARAAGAARAAG